eukprot:s3750_g9.t1
MSEAAFVRRRTEEVAQRSGEVHLAQVSEPADRQVGQQGWLQSHENERKHLQLKRQARRMRAIQEGAVQLDAADAEGAAVYAAWLAHQHRLDAEAMKKGGTVFSQPRAPNLVNQKVWFDEDVTISERDRHAFARKFGLSVSESSLQAPVHVWSGVSRPSQASLCWQAALHGKFIMDPQFFRSGGRTGSSLCFIGAIHTARKVHVTPNFAAANQDLTYDILYLAALPSSKWKYIHQRAEFDEEVAKAARQKKPTSILLFGTNSDPRAGVKLFVQPDTMHELVRVDRMQSASGMQGPQNPFTVTAQGGG